MQFKLRKVLRAGKRYHSRIVRTRRKLGKINSVLFREKKFYSPDSGTGERTRNFIRHLLGFFQMRSAHRMRLPAFLVISSLLPVPDGGTKKCLAVFLCNSKQCDFRIKLYELLYNHFFNITARS